MAPQVDSGSIVAVDAFDIQLEWDRLALDTTTFAALQNMLSRFAPQLVNVDTPLQRTPTEWGSPKRRRKDFEALCLLPENIDETEFARRYRALGEGPEHALTIKRFGRTFRLASLGADGVARGGQPAAS